MLSKILKAYKFRLYPTEEQEAILYQQGGNCRFLWNYFLQINQEEYTKTGNFIFAYDLITSLPKLKEKHPFLLVSFSQSLQQVALQFDRALKDSFKKTKDFPKFHKKSRRRDSFTIPQKFRIEKTYVFLPKIGEVEWVKHRAIKGTVKHLTVSQEGTHWVCSVTVEIKVKNKVLSNLKSNIKGVDVGLKKLAAMSDGEMIENPKPQKNHQKRLNRENRILHRRELGSKNREKQKRKLAKTHLKVKNCRNDYLHKESSKLIAKADGFIMEDLNVKGMMKNHNLAGAIGDVGWYEFKRQLSYKSNWNGKHFIEIGRYEPTSKKCSCCGWIDEGLSLKDREFCCKICGLVLDRDHNAAINILKKGLEKMKIPWDARESTLGDDKRYMPHGRCLSMSQEKEGLGLGNIRLSN